MGGAEQVLKMIAIYYLKKQYEIDVFFLTKSVGNLWDDIKNKVSLHYTQSNKESKGLIKLFKNIRKSKSEYVYGFTSHIYLNSFVGLLKTIHLVKVQYLVGRDSHSYFLVEKGLKRLIYSSLINIGYAGLDLLICQTDEMKNQFILYNKKLSSKILIKVIPNPVDIEYIQSINRIGCNSLQKYDNYIVSAGRLIRAKGFDLLIRAFNQLNLDKYTLVILGEGKERDILENLISELHLKDKVFLCGFADNVYSYFRQAKMCVVSSRNEGFPNVLLQMMSQNEKVVSTLCAGGIDQVKGIFTCQASDEGALAKTMIHCLLSDTSRCKQMFDKELKKRSINEFINQVNLHLNK
jgi:glycosyltransferase involved in cell wall biosynthesis